MNFQKIGFVTVITCMLLILLANTGFSATYYVNATGGRDTNSGTTEGTAWKTIGKINSVNFTSGDTIKFNRGQTWIDATLTLNGTPFGTSGITVEDYGTGAKPRIDGNSVRPIMINQALVNLTLRNLDVSGSDTGNSRVHIEHVNGLTIDGLDYNGHAGSSVYHRSTCLNIVGVAGDIEVKNCTIQNLMKDTFENSVAAWGSLDAHGIILWYPGNNTKLTGSVSIHDNVINNVYADCLQLAGVQVTSNVYNNTFTSFGENAIDNKSSRYTNIYNNEMAGNNLGGEVVSDYWGPNHIVLHSDPSSFEGYSSHDIKIYENYMHTNNGHAIGFGVDNVEIYRNYFKDITCAFKLGGGNGIKIHTNIIEITPSTGARDVYGGTLLSGICFRSSGNFGAYEVYNNTIYINSSIHNYGIAIGGAHTNTSIKNNILYMTRNSAIAYPLYYVGNGTSPTVNHNAYYNPNHTNRAYWSRITYTEANIYTLDGNAVGGNPGLNAVESSQFWPSGDGSEVTDAGTTLTISASSGLHPSTNWPDNVKTVVREDYGGYDIGAYEYLGADNPNPILSAPTNLQLTVLQ